MTNVHTNVVQIKHALENMGAMVQTVDFGDESKDKPKPTRINTDQPWMVNLFHNGNFNVQGIPTGEANMIKTKILSIIESLNDEINAFVVYGHADKDLKILKEQLLRLNIKPLVLNAEAHASNTIIERIEQNLDKATCGFVLMTPDDLGRDKKSDVSNHPRARQNVILELGMLMAKFGRNRVVIINELNDDFEMPSDIGSVLRVQYEKNELQNITSNLYEELNRMN